MTAPFILDSRLAGDTFVVGDLPLSRVLLMNDARFLWLVLVPRQSGLSEIMDLADDDQTVLWGEVNAATRTLRDAEPCNKINIGALGNIVRQLHVHVVARREGDAAWPGPVWGSGKAVPYDNATSSELVGRLRESLSLL
ncbi:diadenosine tetraphosphate (Ap4A) HIT family hydrolase [Luteibacter rhizovicinus]|uniref:Diadenosine tetraphosphate (Ap4A) HIT family hydrolase n=1 Tax=Luteibacter rhizovicinus TaxID=242606 RepID=A0A4V2W476_9GAMM|nr:HIT family protein [Luteibacter rhizovicinus]TCV94789.1 diadenosine tetraphosphate (Ap4A) HIT family hydrolase [Luteibacter rhizovicinus]